MPKLPCAPCCVGQVKTPLAKGCLIRRDVWLMHMATGFPVTPRTPAVYLGRTFSEVAGYDELIVLRNIEFESHCEHHMAPIIGRAHVGYLPDRKVVGISKLARVVDTFARRFQVQEKMTAQIAQCIQEVLQPRGVAVVVDASHECMTTRGVHKRGVSMVTSKMLGVFREDARTRMEFLNFQANCSSR